MSGDKISLFHHAFIFSPLWMFVDLILISHLFISWYYSYRQSGWKLDFWFTFVLINLFLPVLLMYPFNASIFNFIAVGYDFTTVEPYIDRAFGITILGYIMLWLGRYGYDWTHKKPVPHSSNFLTSTIENNLLSKTALHILLAITTALGLLILFMQITNGYLFNPRAFFLENHSARPIFNLAVSIFPITFVFLSLRALILKESRYRTIFFLLLLFSVFLGARGIVLGGIVTYVSLKAFANHGKISLLKLSLLGFLCLGPIFYMESMRNGELNPLLSLGKMVLKIFYGNNFSEVRDFGWVLSCWDEAYVYGKTYIAGALSFLPRFVSDYRQEWAFSVYTNSLVNFNSEVHAGLRIGLFGEPYLNFGLPGVMIVGFLGGYFLRDADIRLKSARNLIEGYAQTIRFTIVSLLFSSVAAWSIYILLLLHAFFFLIRRSNKDSIERIAAF